MHPYCMDEGIFVGFCSQVERMLLVFFFKKKDLKKCFNQLFAQTFLHYEILVYSYSPRQIPIEYKQNSIDISDWFSLRSYLKQDTALKIALFYLSVTAGSTKHKGPACTFQPVHTKT